ncbi:hypothetical protein [Micrococcus sp.]|uniref:hypothetical protein n=1 Tax=Micrococcus sp. TaxID=1271 RepID=UPI002A919FCE|nr:hypothetical protein [Micrococcus sp.]MDY6055102.1 hypothetical protein [Micrococcus sp.]
MPYWSVLYLGLGGLLIGAAWSLRAQRAPGWAALIALVLAGMAIAAAFLTVGT